MCLGWSADEEMDYAQKPLIARVSRATSVRDWFDIVLLSTVKDCALPAVPPTMANFNTAALLAISPFIFQSFLQIPGISLIRPASGFKGLKEYQPF